MDDFILTLTWEDGHTATTTFRALYLMQETVYALMNENFGHGDLTKIEAV